MISFTQAVNKKGTSEQLGVDAGSHGSHSSDFILSEFTQVFSLFRDTIRSVFPDRQFGLSDYHLILLNTAIQFQGMGFSNTLSSLLPRPQVTQSSTASSLDAFLYHAVFAVLPPTSPPLTRLSSIACLLLSPSCSDH